jgi:hypothetical protein
VIVDVDDGVTLWALIEEATKDCASWHPLASRGEVVQLRVSSRDLDDHVLAPLSLGPSGVERVVESRQDLGVAASADIWADGKHHRVNRGVAVRDDRALARTVDRDVRGAW